MVLISKAYVRRRWTRHELKQAQARAFQENKEYILPLVLDDAKVPGLNYTIGHIDLRKHRIIDVAALLLAKLGKGKFEGADLARLGWTGNS